MTSTSSPATPAVPTTFTHRRFGRGLSEVGWWVIIAVLSIADAIGFQQNMQLLVKNGNEMLLWVVVVTSTGAAVLLPWRFGQALIQRRQGTTNTTPVAFVAALLWVALGVVMFIVRVTMTTVNVGEINLEGTDSILGGVDASASASPGTDAWLVAVILSVVFGATGLVAAVHAYERGERKAETAFNAKRAQLVRQLQHEREARDQEDHLLTEARRQHQMIDRIRVLEAEAAEAFANLEYEEKFEQHIRNMHDPVSTELALAEYQSRRNRPPASSV